MRSTASWGQQYRYRVTPEMVRWNQHERASEGARRKCVKVCVNDKQDVPLQSWQEAEVDSRSPADQIRSVQIRLTSMRAQPDGATAMRGFFVCRVCDTGLP